MNTNTWAELEEVCSLSLRAVVVYGPSEIFVYGCPRLRDRVAETEQRRSPQKTRRVILADRESLVGDLLRYCTRHPYPSEHYGLRKGGTVLVYMSLGDFL